MSAAHTPEPWRVAKYEGEPIRENDGSFCISAGAMGTDASKPIGRALYQGDAKRGKQWNAPDPEGLANAHMMAGGPRLSRAAKALADYVLPFMDGKHDLVTDVYDALAACEGR